MQLPLPSRLNFQTRAADITARGLADRLYNWPNIPGPTVYPRGRRGISGVSVISGEPGNMQVTTSTGTDTLNPGDTFTVSLSGMKPGAVIGMEGPGNRYLTVGILPDQTLGVADSSGRFVYTYTVLPEQANPKYIAQVWSNTFSIDGWAAGEYDYTVPHVFVPTAEQLATDPFLHGVNDLPVGSPYGPNPTGNTPLVNTPGWTGGPMTTNGGSPTVPPRTTLTPMQTGFPNTAAVIGATGTTQQPLNPTTGAPAPSVPGTILGLAPNTFYLLAGAGALLLFMGSKKS